MADDEDTQPSSRRSQLDPFEIDQMTDNVLEHIVGESTAAVVKLTDITHQLKDLLSQILHLAQDIQSARVLHRSSMIPARRENLPDK